MQAAQNEVLEELAINVIGKQLMLENCHKQIEFEIFFALSPSLCTRDYTQSATLAPVAVNKRRRPLFCPKNCRIHDQILD